MADIIVTSLCFKKEQYKKVKRFANFEGVSATTYMRQAVLDRIEDEEDYRDAQANLMASQGETVSRAEIMKQLDMDK